MGLKVEDALEVRFKGDFKMFLFKCIECGKDMWKQGNHRLEKATGRCKECNRHFPQPSRFPPFHMLYNRLVRSATERKIPLKITREEFVEFTSETKCHYCYGIIEWIGGRTNLDRIDSSLPYEKGNLVVCCWRCNNTKGSRFTYQEFLQIAAVIRTFPPREPLPEEFFNISYNWRPDEQIKEIDLDKIGEGGLISNLECDGAVCPVR